VLLTSFAGNPHGFTAKVGGCVVCCICFSRCSTSYHWLDVIAVLRLMLQCDVQPCDVLRPQCAGSLAPVASAAAACASSLQPLLCVLQVPSLPDTTRTVHHASVQVDEHLGLLLLLLLLCR
jgi:hypothetical protein